MAMDFPSPSMKASAGDLALQVSPLGLIDISDEEFEVHGPRMIRYANAWAFYLGHHWAYRKQAGEPELVFNYVKALSDFMTNHCFSKGFTVKVDKSFAHITPALLDRVWSKDNDREKLLWSIGQSGSISGDVFIKVSYADPGTDAADPITGAGRVLLLNLHPSHCFPVWHPHVPGKMISFKQKYKFWDTMPDGTRTVNTYVEEITDETIKEYYNDDLIRENPNPLGRIPVVHIANVPVAGSPWGLGDEDGVIPINRQYNETATDIVDILNYHVAPVTIVKGAKATNMEKGPSKMWFVPGEHAEVYNLEGGFQGLTPAIEFLEVLRIRMHEQGHVPETALGQAQPISNTSGVALAIQYMPTTQWAGLKMTQYGAGLKEVSQLALQTLFLKEPNTVQYDPNTDGIMDEMLGQQPFLNPMDPAVYDLDIEFEPNLPIDKIVKLQELTQAQVLGLVSKKSMLTELGEEFPDERIAELEEETMRDAKQQAALRVFNAYVDAAIMSLTGVVPPEGGEPVQSEEPEPGKSASTATAPQQVTPKAVDLPAGIQSLIGGSQAQIMQDIVKMAFMPNVPQRRVLDKDDD